MTALPGTFYAYIVMCTLNVDVFVARFLELLFHDVDRMFPSAPRTHKLRVTMMLAFNLTNLFTRLADGLALPCSGVGLLASIKNPMMKTKEKV